MGGIRYGIDRDTKRVWSQVGAELAIPVFEFQRTLGAPGWRTTEMLERFRLLEVPPEYLREVTWTTNIPVEAKNRHRAFWGLSMLAGKPDVEGDGPHRHAGEPAGMRR